MHHVEEHTRVGRRGSAIGEVGHRPGKSSKQQAANLVLWRQGEALKKGKFFAHLPSVRNCT